MDSSDKTTQLADAKPQFDAPIRVSIPGNAPPRDQRKLRDALILENAFSPAAVLASNSLMTSFDPEKTTNNFSKIKLSPVNMDHDAQIKTAISDFSVVASSSKRGGKKDVEAMACVSMGIIHDNQGNFLQAIEHYQAYCALAEEMNDVAAISCAYNCIGVDYMYLACPPTDAGILSGVNKSQNYVELINKAIIFHKRHLEIGPDAGGHFVANSNLGTCYGIIGEVSQSAKYHQDALRVAIKMQTLYGQSIAVGNLGMLAMIKGDFVTSRTCFEQHLQLVQTLVDPESEVNAWVTLARLSIEQEKYSDALESLEQARKIAEKEKFMNELRRILCLMGLSRGKLNFSDHLDEIIFAAR